MKALNFVLLLLSTCGPLSAMHKTIMLTRVEIRPKKDKLDPHLLPLVKRFEGKKVYPMTVLMSIQSTLRPHDENHQSSFAEMKNTQDMLVEKIFHGHPALITHLKEECSYEKFHKKTTTDKN